MAGGGLQRAVLKSLLSLPPPLLRLLSGGGVVYRGGRTLDPRLQFLAAAGRNAPPMSGMAPEEARRASAEALTPLAGRPAPARTAPLGPGMAPEEAGRASAEGLPPRAGRPEPGVRKESVVLEGRGFPITLRVYRPQDQDPACPVIVWAHFGGGVIGDLET